MGGSTIESGGFKELRDSCVKVLKRHVEEFKGENPGVLLPEVINNAMIDISHIRGDIMEFTIVTCEDVAMVMKVTASGALSTAKALGEHAYTALLEAALKSVVNVGIGYITANSGSLTLILAIPYNDIQVYMKASNANDESAVLKDMLDTMMIARITYLVWLDESLSKLAAGETPEPLDLREKMSRQIKEKGEAKKPRDTTFLFR